MALTRRCRLEVISKKTKIEIAGSTEAASELLGSHQWTEQVSPTDTTWDILVVGTNTRNNKNVVRFIFDIRREVYYGRTLFGVTVARCSH